MAVVITKNPPLGKIKERFNPELLDYLDLPLIFLSLAYININRNNEITFRTKFSFGNWFGEWYHLYVTIALQTTLYLDREVTIRKILDQTSYVLVVKKPTGWIPFLYSYQAGEILMDTLSLIPQN